MTGHKDFLLRDIDIDDFVVFPGPYNGGMKLGKVIKHTASNIRVEYPGWKGNIIDTLRRPSQCVKVEGPDLTFFLLSQRNRG